MDFMSLSLRMAMGNEERFLPYAFLEDFHPWPAEEKSVIEAAIKPYVPERVDAMFNTWVFWYSPPMSTLPAHFTARRATWEMLWGTATAVEMAEKIINYYTDRS